MAFAFALAGCDQSGAGQFNSAVERLNTCLSSTDNDDKDVLAACKEVTEAIGHVDRAGVPVRQYEAMKSAAGSAEIWANQIEILLLHGTKRDILKLHEHVTKESSLDGRKSVDRDLALNIEMAKVYFQVVEHDIRSYVEDYCR